MNYAEKQQALNKVLERWKDKIFNMTISPDSIFCVDLADSFWDDGFCSKGQVILYVHTMRLNGTTSAFCKGTELELLKNCYNVRNRW